MFFGNSGIFRTTFKGSSYTLSTIFIRSRQTIHVFLVSDIEMYYDYEHRTFVINWVKNHVQMV